MNPTPRKRPKNSAKKSAGVVKKAKPSPKSGYALPVGAHPGNTGGKKGRSGRKPDEFKALMRGLVSNDAVIDTLAEVIGDKNHPHYLAALKMAAEFGYGKAAQAVEHSGPDGGAIEVRVKHVVVDPSAN